MNKVDNIHCPLSFYKSSILFKYKTTLQCRSKYLKVGNKDPGARLGVLALDDHDPEAGVALEQGDLPQALVLFVPVNGVLLQRGRELDNGLSAQHLARILLLK